MDTSFQAVVKVFIRVEFRRIRWQVEHFDLVLVLLQPLFDEFAMVNSQVVQNQIYFSTNILGQPAHKGYQALAVHVVAVEHESDFALIADG